MIVGLFGGEERLGLVGIEAPSYGSDSALAPGIRPWGLRWLTEMGMPAAPASYRYCPIRQVSVDAVTGQPVAPAAKVAWTTISLDPPANFG
jgi:putative ATP-grasp target RiPP